MRLTFLLDENILYHAIRGVDKHDNPDTSAAQVIQAIGRICHVIFVHPALIERYQAALKKLREDPPRSGEAQYLVKQLLYNNSKRACEYNELPALPAGVQVPREDVEIVCAALISHPIVVTADSELAGAINGHPQLALKAMDALQALAFAQSELP